MNNQEIKVSTTLPGDALFLLIGFIILGIIFITDNHLGRLTTWSGLLWAGVKSLAAYFTMFSFNFVINCLKSITEEKK